MSEVFEMIAPLSNVNDNSVVVCEHLAEDGASVTKGQPVIGIETSKATSELTAPADGIIRYVVKVGDEVPNGTVLAVVGSVSEDIDEYLKRFDRKIAEKKNENTDPARLSKPYGVNFIKSADSDNTSFGIFENAVTLGEITARDGEKVNEGCVLARVRSSDGIESIKAPVSGYVFWEAALYETIQPGEAAGVISVSGVRPEGIRSKNRVVKRKEIKYGSLRISAAAQRALDEHNTTAQALGLSGLVTAKDVLECFSHDADNGIGRDDTAKNDNTGTEQPKKRRPVHQSEGHFEKLSRSKRSEAAFLSEANNEAVISRVSVLVPTKGIFTECSEDPELAGKFSAIVIMETAALLKKYAVLRSVFEDGNVFIYDDINIGYAISIDSGLKVPVFHKCDGTALDEMITQKETYIEKYIEGSLNPDDLSGGTFTITDMSQSGCFMFDPVLNLGQSAILGIGGENTTHTEYPLILAFDHRVCDGMTAAAFLNELKERLIAHENALLPEPDKEDDVLDREVYCDYCFRDAQELSRKGHYLFKSVDENGEEKYICSICAAGY